MLKIEQVGGKQKTGSGPSVWEGLFSMCERVIR